MNESRSQRMTSSTKRDATEGCHPVKSRAGRKKTGGVKPEVSPHHRSWNIPGAYPPFIREMDYREVIHHTALGNEMLVDDIPDSTCKENCGDAIDRVGKQYRVVHKTP